MGNLVFQATLGGQVSLVGPNTASTFNINVPTVNGNMVTTGDTGTVTNTMCATSVYTAPGTIGSGTPNTGAFTTLSASGVASFAAGSASAPALTRTGDTNTGMFFPAADTIAFAEGGTETMRLDSSGNMGLGVTPSAYRSSEKAFQVGSYSSFSDVGGYTIVGSNFYTNSSNQNIYRNTAAATAYGQTAGQHQWFTVGSGTAGASFSFTQAMTLDASGNLGVGTTSPTAYSGYKTLSLNGSNGGVLEFKLGDAQQARISNSGGALLQFVTNGTEAMRIDSSGNLLVGTTSALLSTAKLNVFNTTGGNGGIAVGYGSSAGQYRVIYLISSNGGMYFDNGSNAAYLNSAGAWTNASDARLKNSITDIKYGLSAVLSAQPRSYKMNDLEGDYIGFVAQELKNVIPEVVSGDPEKQLGVDYGSLVAVAFKAIQELNAKFEAYKAAHP